MCEDPKSLWFGVRVEGLEFRVYGIGLGIYFEGSSLASVVKVMNWIMLLGQRAVLLCMKVVII